MFEVAVLSVSVMAPAPACVIPPVSEIAPLAVIPKVLEPTEEVPMTKAPPLVSATALAPVLFKETAPVKLLLCVKVIALAPAVKLEVPGTVKMPDCVMAPPELIVKFCPTLEAANCKAPLVVSETGLEPLLLKVTAPVSALLCVKVMALPPAVKLEVPGTIKAPVCVMAPPAVTAIEPPLFKVKAGKAMAALLKFKVKLLKALSEAKLVGRAALA